MGVMTQPPPYDSTPTLPRSDFSPAPPPASSSRSGKVTPPKFPKGEIEDHEPLLVPVSPPVALHPHLVSEKPTTLVLEGKVCSFSGNDYTINDIDGNVVAKCVGSGWSVRQRKELFDAQGQPLFQIVTKLLSSHHTYLAKDENDATVLMIRKKWGIKPVIDATFYDTHTNAATNFTLHGDYMERNATIMFGDQVMARVQRKFFNKKAWGGAHTFYVNIAPGVDQSVVVALILCLDQIEHDRSYPYA